MYMYMYCLILSLFFLTVTGRKSNKWSPVTIRLGKPNYKYIYQRTMITITFYTHMTNN